MEIEKKIQDDFEFYCKFTETFPTKKPFPKQEDNYLCEVCLYLEILIKMTCCNYQYLSCFCCYKS